MTCREAIEFLGDYLDGQLPGATRDRFDEHLGACSQCRRYLSQYRLAVDLAKVCADDHAAEHLPPELIAAILSATKK